MVHDGEVVPEGRRDREPLTHVLAWAGVEHLATMLTNYLSMFENYTKIWNTESQSWPLTLRKICSPQHRGSIEDHGFCQELNQGLLSTSSADKTFTASFWQGHIYIVANTHHTTDFCYDQWHRSTLLDSSSLKAPMEWHRPRSVPKSLAPQSPTWVLITMNIFKEKHHRHHQHHHPGVSILFSQKIVFFSKTQYSGFEFFQECKCSFYWKEWVFSKKALGNPSKST